MIDNIVSLQFDVALAGWARLYCICALKGGRHGVCDRGNVFQEARGWQD